MKCLVIGCWEDPVVGGMYCREHVKEGRDIMMRYRDGVLLDEKKL